MFARVSRFQESPDKIDEANQLAQEKIVPQAQTMPGFVGLVSLANRNTGETLTITYWESEEAMQSSEGDADRLRDEAARLGDAEIRNVERYEVLLRVGV